MQAARRILMIAYHYPPIQASSGVHRALSFSSHLAKNGWRPAVLTVARMALLGYRDENESMVPAGVQVLRAPALDTIKHLSLFGRYPAFLAIPDRWVSWIAGGVVRGLAYAWWKRPICIYSTYPIASAHLIGYFIHRLSGIPWIADFRDPMAQDDYPADPRVWRAFRRIEELAIRHASRLVFTAPGAKSYYEDVFGSPVRERGVVIENGYDEELFELAEHDVEPDPAPGPLRFIHAGILYPEERDPRSFFAAVRALVDRGVVAHGAVEFVLRGSGNEAQYREMLDRLELNEIIRLEPAVGYRAALVEMMTADALMLFQSEDCNFQIPAKTYEYFRARRPIVAFTDPSGDTANTLRAAGVTAIAPLDSPEEIERVLSNAIVDLRENPGGRWGSEAVISACSREARAQEFLSMVESLS